MKKIHIAGQHLVFGEAQGDALSFNFPSMEKISADTVYFTARQIRSLSDPKGKILARTFNLQTAAWTEMPSPTLWDETAHPSWGYYMCHIQLLEKGQLCAVYSVIDTDETKPLFHPTKDGVQKTWIRTCKSFDGGASWTEPKDLEFQLPDMIIPGKGMRFGPDTFGFSCEVHHEWDKGFREGPSARLIFSRDNGETFPEAVVMARDTGIIYGDARMTMDDDGVLTVFFWKFDTVSGHDQPIHRVISRDGGKTFSKPEPICLTMQITSPMYLDPRHFLCICQDRHSQTPGIKALLSPDGGMTWDLATETTLFSANGQRPDSENPFSAFESFKFGYSTLCKLDSQTVLALYWHAAGEKTAISFTRLELA